MAGNQEFDRDDLWAPHARDWADHQEPCFVPLYEEAFFAAGVGPGTRLLDAGCGSGLAAAMAAERGATVSGFDPSAVLLDIARRRVPAADLRRGLLEAPPHPPGSFDVITLFNVVHHTDDPTMLRPLYERAVEGGRMVVTTWAPADRCQIAEALSAVGAWDPAQPDRGPFALSPAGKLEELVARAGFPEVEARLVSCPFGYDDMDVALAGLVSAAPFVAVGRHIGERAVRERVRRVLMAHRTADGRVVLHNVFRMVLARR